MRWWVVLLMVITCGACGGFTKPDGGDWSQFIRRIADLPEEQREDAKAWIVARRAAEQICDDLPSGTRLGVVDCHAAGHEPSEIDVTSDEMCECLRVRWEADTSPSYDWCWLHLQLRAAQQYGVFADDTGAPVCRYRAFAGWHFEEHPEWDPDNVTDDEILRELIGSSAPPPWLAGQLFDLIPILCPLGASWSCPGDPFYPDGASSSGSTSGGAP